MGPAVSCEVYRPGWCIKSAGVDISLRTIRGVRVWSLRDVTFIPEPIEIKERGFCEEGSDRDQIKIEEFSRENSHIITIGLNDDGCELEFSWPAGKYSEDYKSYTYSIISLVDRESGMFRIPQ